MKQRLSLFPPLAVLALLSACDGGRVLTPSPVAAPDGALGPLAQCVLEDPRRTVGEGIDAPGRLEVDHPPVGSASGACAGNQAFAFGSGLADITGVIANTSGMGWENPQQVFSALHSRLYSRAYAIESPCNGQRILFVSADLGLLRASVRRGVLAAIAADPALAAVYGPSNVMLSPTHTHAGPAGYAHDDGTNIFHYGYDDLVYQGIVSGIVESIQLAHANIEAQPQTGPIRLATGELLNTNINRSLPAFLQNSEAERAEFLNARGEEITVNKRVVQLDLVRNDGSAVGIINWFGVHPTVVGPTSPFVSSDIKGFASLGFERLMGTRYDPVPGRDTFVAAFAQADEGDSSPNIRVLEFPHPDPRRGGGEDDLDSNAISGTKHLAKALELFGSGAPLRGPVDVRFMRVPIDAISIDDPAVLASLEHPAELDAVDKRTCSGALGVSFGAGAEDGPGPTVEGVSCASSATLQEAAFNDVTTLMNTTLAGFPGTWPAYAIPPHAVSAAAMCNISALPPILGDFSCQAEKPVFLPTGENIIPLQLFRIGNFALLGVPWEVTTIAARRLRELLLAELAPAGVDTLVIAGLVNDYVHYLTTREEFSAQHYEGASTLFGPWSHAAVAQESLKLARAMRQGVAIDAGPPKPDATPRVIRPPYIASDGVNLLGAPGTLVSDVPATAAPGDTVSAEWVAGHPRNDLRIGASYVYAERRNALGDWVVVAQDRDPELLYLWQPLIPSPLPIDPPLIGPSTAAAVWTIPRNAPAGSYRLRHEGAAQTLPLTAVSSYSGESSPFEVSAPGSDCP